MIKRPVQISVCFSLSVELLQHLSVAALNELWKLKKKIIKKDMSKHAQCKYCKWNANASTENSSWAFFSCLSGFEHLMGGKNVFICRKTCSRKNKHFPFNTLEEKFTIMVSVKAARKDLSSFQAMKSCPQCWCL